MRHRRLALTGPSAAALYGLDGFRDRIWPPLWCAPMEARSGDRIIRTRKWQEPNEIDGVRVCPLPLVIRHLHAVPADTAAPTDGLTARERVELAVEHAIRLDASIDLALGGAMPGDVILRQIMSDRGAEPATGSYAETRAAQLFRSLNMTVWRQVPVARLGRIEFRADFMLPFDQTRRPEVFRPSMGLLVEIDSREFHERQFDRDHHRGSTYDELGYHWVSFTPNQIERDPAFVHRALQGAMSRTRDVRRSA